MVAWFDLVRVECFYMIELIVVVLMSKQCGKFTYSAYGFSSIGSWLYSTVGEVFYYVIKCLSIKEEIHFTE